MNYILSAHAQLRILERKIPKHWLDETLDKPQQIVNTSYGRQIFQSIFIKNDKQWMLRVIVQENLVITALLTSKIDKYRGEL
jgi:acetylglutamate synthase